MDIERTKKPIKQVSLVPLINVVFLLLIFFLVAGTVKEFEVLPVELPAADSGQLLDEGSIVVVLGAHQEVLVNDELIQEVDLIPILEEQLSLNKERIITIKADATMQANRLIQMLDQIKLAGGQNISLVTQSL